MCPPAAKPHFQAFLEGVIFSGVDDWVDATIGNNKNNGGMVHNSEMRENAHQIKMVSYLVGHPAYEVAYCYNTQHFDNVLLSFPVLILFVQELRSYDSGAGI